MLEQQLHDPQITLPDRQCQVLGIGLHTISQQHLDQTVEGAVDGDPERRAPNILVLVVGRLPGFNQASA